MNDRGQVTHAHTGGWHVTCENDRIKFMEAELHELPSGYAVTSRGWTSRFTTIHTDMSEATAPRSL